MALYVWAGPYLESRCIFGRHTFAQMHPSFFLCPWRLTFLAVASFVAGKAVGLFLTHLCGVDVDWSMRLAMRHCDRREWIHASTSIVSSYARVAGAFLGTLVLINHSSCNVNKL